MNEQERRQIQNFKDNIKKAFGDIIRIPTPVRLGYKDSSGTIYVDVPPERTDQPGKYYFQEIGGTPFQGEAYLKQGALERWQIRFGTPIIIEKNPLSKEWEITGIDTRYAAQFFDGISENDYSLWGYQNLSPGALLQKTPPDMSAQVLSASYRIGDSIYYARTLSTVDWAISPYSDELPVTNLKARYVLVQIEPITETLEYKYGNEFPSYYSINQVVDLNKSLGDNSIIPNPDNGYFKSGYIRLSYGQETITNSSIWSVQDYLTVSTVNEEGATLDKIITSGGSVVVDGATGNVVYTMN